MTETRAGGTTQAIVLLLPATLVVMATAALAPGLPQLRAAFADTPGEQWLVPMILTLPSLCLIIFSPLAGMLGDRFGRRTMLLWGLCIYALIGLAPLMLDSLTAILISRIGVGIAEAFALTLSTTLIGDYFSGRDRDKWLGYQTGVTSVSAIFLVGMGGALGQFGWRGPFAIYALPLLFALLIYLFTWEPDRTSRKQHSDVPVVFPWRTMLGICAVTLFASITFYVAQIQNGVALAATGLRNPAQIGMLIGVSALGTLGGTILFRFISSWPVTRLLVAAFVAIGLGYVGVGMADSTGALVGAMTVAQFGCGILLPSLLTWAVRSVPAEARGRGTGIWQGVFSIGQFMSPISVTLAAGALGGILPAFAFFGVLNIGAAALVVLLILLLAARKLNRPAVA